MGCIAIQQNLSFHFPSKPHTQWQYSSYLINLPVDIRPPVENHSTTYNSADDAYALNNATVKKEAFLFPR